MENSTLEARLRRVGNSTTAHMTVTLTCQVPAGTIGRLERAPFRNDGTPASGRLLKLVLTTPKGPLRLNTQTLTITYKEELTLSEVYYMDNLVVLYNGTPLHVRPFRLDKD